MLALRPTEEEPCLPPPIEPDVVAGGEGAQGEESAAGRGACPPPPLRLAAPACTRAPQRGLRPDPRAARASGGHSWGETTARSPAPHTPSLCARWCRSCALHGRVSRTTSSSTLSTSLGQSGLRSPPGFPVAPSTPHATATTGSPRERPGRNRPAHLASARGCRGKTRPESRSRRTSWSDCFGGREV